MVMVPPKSPRQRLREYSTPTEGGCLLWTGRRNSGGYGEMQLPNPNGKGKIRALAHRVSWEEHNQQPIPAGLLIRHTCDNPACIEPSHLLLGDAADNARDRKERGRNYNPVLNFNPFSNAIPDDLCRCQDCGRDMSPFPSYAICLCNDQYRLPTFLKEA